MRLFVAFVLVLLSTTGAAQELDRPGRGWVLYETRGCRGCHDPAFETSPAGARDQIAAERAGIERARAEAREGIEAADGAMRRRGATVEELLGARRDREVLGLALSRLAVREEALDRRRAELATAPWRAGPDLRRVRAGLRPAWLLARLADPDWPTGGSRMPRFALRTEEAEAIAAYLWRTAPDVRYATPGAGDAQRGRTLFESIGCLGCHAAGGSGGDLAPDLSSIGDRAGYAFLATWLRRDDPAGDPRIAAHRPDLRLDEGEARDIASYLVTLVSAGTPPTDEVPEILANDDLVQEGRALVAEYRCGACHVLAESADRSPVAARPGSGTCLDAADPPHAPRRPAFHLPDDEVDALRAFLASDRADRAADPVAAGERLIARDGCRGCHRISPEDVPAIQATPAFQGESWIYHAIPSLVDAGERLKQDWLASYLIDPSRTVRSHQLARMPGFDLPAPEALALARYFAAVGGDREPADRPVQPLSGPEFEAARALFAAADCVLCHDHPDPKWKMAPSYLDAPARLRPRALRRFLIDPQAFSPGTRMPSGLFEEVDGRATLRRPLPAELAGKPLDHVDLLVRYCLSFDRVELEYQRSKSRR